MLCDEEITRTPTRTATSAITVTFPVIGIHDDFNRTDGGIGASWTYDTTSYAIDNNRLMGYGYDEMIIWTEAFGADQEAYTTYLGMGQDSAGFSLVLKGIGYADGSAQAIEVNYNPSNEFVSVYTLDTNGDNWVNRGYLEVPLSTGDQFVARATSAGRVEIFRNGMKMGEIDITGWGHNQEGGLIGLWTYTNSDNPMVLDDFGGGDVVEAGLSGLVNSILDGIGDWFNPGENGAETISQELPSRMETLSVAATLTAGQVWTFYYYAGNGRVAMRIEGNTDDTKNGVIFLFSDHLGSTTLTYNVYQDTTAVMGYKPWGGELFRSGDPQTNYRYTGQRYHHYINFLS